MPGKRCCVVTCNNNVYKTKKLENIKIMYHRFPRDTETRKQWINNCGKEGLWNPDHGWICSEHFTDDAYERDLKAELLHLPSKRRLKQNAIPNLNLPKSQELLSIKLKTINKIKKRKVQFANILKLTPNEKLPTEDLQIYSRNKPTILKRKGQPTKRPRLQEINSENLSQIHEIKHEILEINTSNIEREENILNATNNEQKKVVEDMKIKYEYLLKQNENLLMKNITLEKELKQVEELKKLQEEKILKEKEELEKKTVDLCALLETQVEALKNQEELKKKNNELSTQISSLKFIDDKNKKLILNLESKLKNSKLKDESCIEKLKQTFTQNQIDLLLKRKNKVPWTAQEVTQACTIRYYSKRCYNYLRQKLNYPLPGLTTLKYWSANSMKKQGILTDVFNSLKETSKNYSESDKIVVLKYNVIKGTCENDQINDKIARPYSRVPVIQAHGLFSEWKHIIYVDFEKIFTIKELFNIIKNFDAINFKVIAFVGDCGAQKLWYELNVSVDKSWFLNPTTNEKIYVFADASHLLKLLRNWFLDSGLTWENGKNITQEHINTLLYMNNNGELDESFNLTSKHITCKGVQRRVLNLATELFSHNTSNTIKKYLPDDLQVIETADFIELVSNWYDIFNSNSPKNKVNPLKSSFGCYLIEQKEILEKMFTEIYTMHCGSRDNNMIFQRAILMSINSLLLLQKDCEVIYKKNYIITQKLQQDSLEMLLTQLNTNKTQESNPTDCLERLRMIIMGKIPDLQKVSAYINTTNNNKHIQIKDKNKKVKKEYVFSMIDGQYVLKENIISDNEYHEEKLKDNIINETQFITQNNINQNDNNTNILYEDNCEVTSEDIEEIIINDKFKIEEETDNIFTISIDPNSNDEMSEGYLLSAVLKTAGINIDEMAPGETVEVVIENSNEYGYDDGVPLHQVQIIDAVE